MSATGRGATRRVDGKTYGAIENTETAENIGRSSDKITKLKTQVSEVKSILRDDIEKVIERDDRIQDLNARTVDLECNATQFKKSAVVLRKVTQSRNCKLTACIIVIVVVVLVVIVLIILAVMKIV